DWFEPGRPVREAATRSTHIVRGRVSTMPLLGCWRTRTPSRLRKGLGECLRPPPPAVRPVTQASPGCGERAGRRRALAAPGCPVLALDSLFPDARFVFLERDGRAADSSLIAGWRAEASTFGGVSLPRPIAIDGYDGTEWRFVVPPGWEAYARGRTLAEVCAFQ